MQFATPASSSSSHALDEEDDGAAFVEVCTSTMQPPHLYTTAERQRGNISFEGRSPTSKAWSGGAAYAIRCGRCGLEPGRVGFVSKCLCTCTLCFEPLNGKKVCPSRYCGHNQPVEGSGVDDGRPRSPEAIPIATQHVKAKRRRHVAVAGPAVAMDAVVVDDSRVVIVSSDDDDEAIPKCFSRPSADGDEGTKHVAVCADEDDAIPKCFSSPTADADVDRHVAVVAVPLT